MSNFEFTFQARSERVRHTLLFMSTEPNLLSRGIEVFRN